MKPISTSALRKLILARQGLLHWRGGSGAYGEGVPWKDELKGSAGTHEVLRRLEAVQLDPVNVVAPNHHLVFGNRVGGYKPEHLEALYPAKHVFEYWAQARCILPIEDWSLFEWRRELWKLEHNIENSMIYSRSESYGREVTEAVEYIREKLSQGNSLPMRALDTGKKVRGYWGFTTKATSQAIEHMWEAGHLVVSERRNEERHYALTEGWLPKIPPTPFSKGGKEEKLLKFIRAYGVLDAYGSGSRLGWRDWEKEEKKATLERLVKEKQLIPLEIADARIKRQYYLWGELTEMLEGLSKAKVSPKIWFISPLDNLIWRRERISDFFGFDYKWEIYVPEHKRNYGPYILPILEGERFVGRLDARMNREKKQLEVRRIFWETQAHWPRIKKALEGFAESLGANLYLANGGEIPE